MTSLQTIESLLQPFCRGPRNHVKAALQHYYTMAERFRVGDFENCLGKAGKFIEATLKALYVHAGKQLPPARKFTVSKIISELAQLDPNHVQDSIRLLIPRACTFAYDLASNRGGRHDADIDANEMDARIAMETCSWVLAEMIRFSQRGRLVPSRAREIVEGLTEKKYRIVEEIDGRVYFEREQKSALDVALVTLWRSYPARVTKSDLKRTIMRHAPRPTGARFSENAANVALTRIATLVDDDGTGNFKLLNSGLARAERLVFSGNHV